MQIDVRDGNDYTERYSLFFFSLHALPDRRGFTAFPASVVWISEELPEPQTENAETKHGTPAPAAAGGMTWPQDGVTV